MRLIATAIVMIGLPALAGAQSSVRDPTVFAPLPRIGLPAERIGLPLPRIGLPPVSDSRVHPGTDRTIGQDGRARGRTGKGRGGRTAVYFFPMYGWGYSYPIHPGTPTPGYTPEAEAPRKAVPRTGRLRLDVRPDRGLQIYVDGYYVGTADDFGGELEIEAGAHAIELRAPGYQPLTFDVRIPPGRSITYQGELRSDAPAPAADVPAPAPAAATPPASTTIYFIPGCYLGNVPPGDAGLPATCDLGQTVTFKN